MHLDWLRARGPVFTAGIAVASLDPLHEYKNAIDDGLEDAVAVLDAFLSRKRRDPQSSSSPPQPAPSAAHPAHSAHEAVHVAWQCAQDVRAVYHQPTLAAGRAMAEKLIAALPGCPAADPRDRPPR